MPPRSRASRASEEAYAGSMRVMAVWGTAGAVLACVMTSCSGAGGAQTQGARPAAPAADPARAAGAGAAPSQERRAFWKDVRSRGDAPPEGADVPELAMELVGYLSSTDPDVRDGLAYEVLARWIGRDRRLSHDAVIRIEAVLLERLRDHVGAVGDDTVFGRSFSALILGEIAGREVEEQAMSDDQLTAMVQAARAYASTERDLRGHVEGRGWAHAAAHTADWLDALARNPRLGRERAQVVLDAVLELTVRRHGHILFHGEDARLAQPILDLLGREHVDGAMFSAWLARLLAPLGVKGGPAFDAGLYAAQRNARNLAFTLFVRLSLEEKRSAAQSAALAALTSSLRG
jgi:hypothetical protein